MCLPKMSPFRFRSQAFFFHEQDFYYYITNKSNLDRAILFPELESAGECTVARMKIIFLFEL
jgi:hypothetical protein